MAEAEINDHKKAIRKLDRVTPWVMSRPAYKNDRVQIYFIYYGGKFIWNDDVARGLLFFAENESEFELNDRLFADDPWPGNPKIGLIIYPRIGTTILAR